MRKTILTLTILLTLAGTLIPAQSVQAAPPDAPLRDLVTTNDNNQLVGYVGAGWTYTTALSGYAFEDRHASAVTGDYSEFRFYGRTISLLAGTSDDQGEAEIYLDTVLQDTVDLYSATPAPQQVVFALGGLDLEYHTIKVVVAGTKNASSSGYVVNIDAFRFEDAAVEEPPASNDIECRAQNNPAVMTCTQNGPQAITLVSTDGILYIDYPNWRLNAGGIGTVYARLTGISERWLTSPWSGSGSVTFNFGVKRNTYQQTRVIGTYYASSWQWAAPVSVDDFSDSYIFTAAGDYQSHIDSTQAAPQPHFQARFTYVLQLQTVPFANECIQNYTSLLTAGPYEIDPTIEDPLGPEGSPADEQIFPITPGYTYMVRVGGEGWHDGAAADQFESEYSWDGVTWTDLQSATCVSDTEGYYRYSAIVQAPAELETFYIRAKDQDDPANFADNYMDGGDHFVYTISYVIFTGIMDCASQFTFDEEADLVASVILDADEPYELAADDLTIGEWYVIEIASGSWQDDGAPPDRYDAQFSWGNVLTGDPDGIWNNIDTGGSGVYCETEDGDYSTIYTQAQAGVGSTLALLYLRVGDTALTFPANTGSLTINIYAASFERRPSTCELGYTADKFIGHSEIHANAENGLTIGISSSINDASLFGTMRMVPGAWYMIETTDGPWGWVGSTHSELSYLVEVFWGGAWVPLESWSQSPCNIEIDALGHRRVFFQTPSTGGAEYKFRVADSATWFNNVGNMGIDLYGAFDMEVSLPGGGCDYIADTDNPVVAPEAPIIVSGADADGEYITAALLTAGNIYAFEILGNTYDWQESAGGADLYAMQVSDDNGASWQDVPGGYGGVLCYIQNGNNTLMFIRIGSGYIYRFRVDSESFSDNTGSMGIAIYSANAGDTIDPWTSCMAGQGLWIIDDYIPIDVRLAEGEIVPYSDAYLEDDQLSGFAIKIDPSSGPWYDGETSDQHYDAELSSDNGTTWYPLDHTNPDIICAKFDFVGLYATAYFAVTADQIWKIRVNDEDTTTFTDNSGNLAYKLYAVTAGSHVPDCQVETNNPDCIDWSEFPSGILINGNDICTSSAIRPVVPASLIDVPAWLGWVGGWISYSTHVVLQYFAWCPRHTDALLALRNVFKTKEPIATLVEMLGLVDLVRSQADSYNWEDTSAEASGLFTDTSPSGGQDGGGAAAGGVATSIIDRIFPAMAPGGPWSGGPLIENLEVFAGGSSFTSCTSTYTEMIPNTGLVTGLCFVTFASRLVGGSFILQILLDIGVLALFVRFTWGSGKSLAEFMAGGNSTA